jgi:regulator of chromosome condensation
VVVAKNGKAYSWGFSDGFRTGQGTESDVKTPTLLGGPFIFEKHLIWAGANGSYSFLAADADADD